MRDGNNSGSFLRRDLLVMEQTELRLRLIMPRQDAGRPAICGWPSFPTFLFPTTIST